MLFLFLIPTFININNVIYVVNILAAIHDTYADLNISTAHLKFSISFLLYYCKQVKKSFSYRC